MFVMLTDSNTLSPCVAVMSMTAPSTQDGHEQWQGVIFFFLF